MNLTALQEFQAKSTAGQLEEAAVVALGNLTQHLSRSFKRCLIST